MKTLIMLILYLEQARGHHVGGPWSSWNKFIAAIHAPTTFRMVFCTLCYYFEVNIVAEQKQEYWWRIFCFL